MLKTTDPRLALLRSAISAGAPQPAISLLGVLAWRAPLGAETVATRPVLQAAVGARRMGSPAKKEIITKAGAWLRDHGYVSVRRIPSSRTQALAGTHTPNAWTVHAIPLAAAAAVEAHRDDEGRTWEHATRVATLIFAGGTPEPLSGQLGPSATATWIRLATNLGCAGEGVLAGQDLADVCGVMDPTTSVDHLQRLTFAGLVKWSRTDCPLELVGIRGAARKTYYRVVLQAPRASQAPSYDDLVARLWSQPLGEEFGEPKTRELLRQCVARAQQSLGRPYTREEIARIFLRPVIAMQDIYGGYPQAVYAGLRACLMVADSPLDRNVEARFAPFCRKTGEAHSKSQLGDDHDEAYHVERAAQSQREMEEDMRLYQEAQAAQVAEAARAPKPEPKPVYRSRWEGMSDEQVDAVVAGSRGSAPVRVDPVEQARKAEMDEACALLFAPRD